MDWVRAGGFAAVLGLLGGVGTYAFLAGAHERSTGRSIDLEAGSGILAGAALVTVVVALAVVGIAAAIQHVRGRR